MMTCQGRGASEYKFWICHLTLIFGGHVIMAYTGIEASPLLLVSNRIFSNNHIFESSLFSNGNIFQNLSSSADHIFKNSATLQSHSKKIRWLWVLSQTFLDYYMKLSFVRALILVYSQDFTSQNS